MSMSYQIFFTWLRHIGTTLTSNVYVIEFLVKHLTPNRTMSFYMIGFFQAVCSCFFNGTFNSNPMIFVKTLAEPSSRSTWYWCHPIMIIDDIGWLWCQSQKSRVSWVMEFFQWWANIFRFLVKIKILKEMVFFYQNCFDLLWEKIVLVIEKNFEVRGWRWEFAKFLRSLE